MLTTKLKLIIGGALILIIGTLFALWRITSIKLENTQNQLTEVSAQLETVAKENANLVEYNKRRDSQLKELQKAYEKQLSSIPADLCGDMKPSKELLDFFKEGR